LEYRARTKTGYRWIRLAGRKMPAINRDGDVSYGPVLQGVVADVHELRTAQTERVDLLKRLGEAQEDEQRRIARELHDQIGQTLTGLSLGLKTLERDIEQEPLRSRVVWLETLTSEISRDIHRVAADLRPDGLDDLGLARALSALAAELNRRHSVNFDIQALGLTERLPAKIENAAFRIVQEGFTNVLKHARATNASAILERLENCLRIVVEDDGIGSRHVDDDECDTRVRVNTLGLFGIRERLASLGGQLQIESAPGQGMSLFIEIPLHNQIGHA
jgi:two-component system sensor histidine kinase UhpB